MAISFIPSSRAGASERQELKSMKRGFVSFCMALPRAVKVRSGTIEDRRPFARPPYNQIGV